MVNIKESKVIIKISMLINRGRYISKSLEEKKSGNRITLLGGRE